MLEIRQLELVELDVDDDGRECSGEGGDKGEEGGSEGDSAHGVQMEIGGRQV